jgi:hypothetical protein
MPPDLITACFFHPMFDFICTRGLPKDAAPSPSSKDGVRDTATTLAYLDKLCDHTSEFRSPIPAVSQSVVLLRELLREFRVASFEKGFLNIQSMHLLFKKM